MSWFAALRAEADPLWQAIHRHPFLAELAAGTLPRSRFRFYILQDYPYLKEFCRVLALAAARGGRIEDMGFFAGLLHTTLTVEMEMHRSFCAELSISPRELEDAVLAPTAHAYTRHLLAVGALGSQAEMLVALAPCIMSYAEIGHALAGRKPETPLYRRWIEGYASPEYQSIAARAISLVDEIERETGPAERARCREHFMLGSRYEWMFWEMAYREEAWRP